MHETDLVKLSLASIGKINTSLLQSEAFISAATLDQLQQGSVELMSFSPPDQESLLIMKSIELQLQSPGLRRLSNIYSVQVNVDFSFYLITR